MDAATTMVSQMPPPPAHLAFHPAQDQLVQAATADSCSRELCSTTTTDNPETYGFNTEQYFWVVHEQSEQQQAAGLVPSWDVPFPQKVFKGNL